MEDREFFYLARRVLLLVTTLEFIISSSIKFSLILWAIYLALQLMSED